MFRNLLSVTAAIALAGSVLAQPAPKKADDTKLITRIYDLKSIIGEKKTASGISEVDGVIKTILDVINPGELKTGTAGPQLIERENGKLEVHATDKVHEEITDLIEALNRLGDIAVDVKAEVIELDQATFAKLQKSIPQSAKGKAESPVLFAIGEGIEGKDFKPEDLKLPEKTAKVLKDGRIVQTSASRIVNGCETTFSARQSVQTYHESLVNNKPMGMPKFVKEGFKLGGIPVVSGDRRFVRLKLTENSTVIAGIKNRDFGEPGPKGQRLIVTSPEVEDLGSTASATVADGGTVLFRLSYAPKDKVWIVALQATIYIKAEDDELKKQGVK